MLATTPKDFAIVTLVLQPHKRNEYDRGTKKIIVNGVHWGWLYMESHGVHGPSYHTHDLHDPVMVPCDKGPARRKHDPVAATFSPKGRSDYRWSGVKPPSTEAQLIDYVRGLIEGGHLREPDIRAREVAEARERHRITMEEFERDEKRAFDSRVQEIIDLIGVGRSHAREDEIRAAIIDAMKWAQTQ